MNAATAPDYRLKQRVQVWARRLKVSPQVVRVRRMTRKWGSCSTAGTITLAADLDDQNDRFQDFVIAHELLHLRVPNHGRLFKALMTAYVPNWRALDVARRSARSRPRVQERLNVRMSSRAR